MSKSASISLEASSATVTMDTTKMTTFLTSVLILMSAWKADLTATSVLICREGEKLNSIYIRWRAPCWYSRQQHFEVDSCECETSNVLWPCTGSALRKK